MDYLEEEDDRKRWDWLCLKWIWIRVFVGLLGQWICVLVESLINSSVFAVQLLFIVCILTPFLPTRMHLANNKI